MTPWLRTAFCLLPCCFRPWCFRPWYVVNAEKSFPAHESSDQLPLLQDDFNILQDDFSMSFPGTGRVLEVESSQADVLLQRSFNARSHTETVVIESTVVRTTKTRTIQNAGEEAQDEYDSNDDLEAESYINLKDSHQKQRPPLQSAQAFDHDFVDDVNNSLSNLLPTKEKKLSNSPLEDLANRIGQSAGLSKQASQSRATQVTTTMAPTQTTSKPGTSEGYEEDLPVVVVSQSPQDAKKQGIHLAACSTNPSALITVPIDQPCSEACPFSQRLPRDKCHKVCITKEQCGKFNPKRSFAESKSNQCMPACGYSTHIIGCNRCAGVGVCVECMTGFILVQNGTRCQNTMEGVWKMIYGIIAALIVLFAWYLWNLARRPQVNKTVLEMTFQHRDHCKCWELWPDKSKKHGKSWHRYPLWSTLVQNRDVGGLGIVLYFRQLGFAMSACPILLLAAYITYSMSELKAYEDATAHLGDCQSIVAHSARFNGAQFEQDIVKFSHYMFYAMTATYLLVLLGIAIFAKTQRNLSNRWDESRATHEDYAFLVKYLPFDATEPKEIQEYFQGLLDNASPQGGVDSVHQVVGVSIAYDYKPHAELIDNAICDWVEDLERTRWSTHPHTSDHFKHVVETCVKTNRWYHTHHDAVDGRGSNISTHEKERKCCTCHSMLTLQCLDTVFLGSCGDQDPGHADEEKVASVLKELKGSGDAYVVVNHPSTLALMSEIGSKPLPLFRGEYKIHIQDVCSEPPSIIWENFTEMNFWPRIIAGLFLIVGVIVLWVALYIPYAVLIGEHTGFVQGLLLGLLIAIGNVIVAKVIDWVTSWAGFRRKDRRDVAILALAFLATVMNTVCDVFVVLRITNSSGGMSHDFDKVLAPELLAMIVPGYLILPYIFVPLAEHVAPYYMGVWFVRSRQTTLRASEKCLMCPDFDICWRYSDLLNNFTVCIMMLFIVSAESYYVMMWLMVFLVLIYNIDKYKLLRQTTQTFYTTRRLDEAALYWWSVPTGVLAAAATWWACSAQILAEDHRRQYCYFAFGLNIIIFLVLLKFAESFVRPAAPETKNYSEMTEELAAKGKMWSWFNTNPVFCLRSKFLGLKESSGTHPCVPYVAGKQHLQPHAPQHFVDREGNEIYKAKLGSQAT